MTSRSRPPTLRITDPDHAYIAATLRLLGWRSMRDLVRRAGCSCTENRVGLLSKRFVVRGDGPALQKFVNLAWTDKDIGPSFREEVRNAV